MQHFSPYSLKACNSFGFDVEAKQFWRVDTPEELPALMDALRRSDPTASSPDQTCRPILSEFPMIIGGGSNLLITGPIQRPLVQFAFREVAIVRQQRDEVWVQAGAGMPWHEFVMWTLSQGLFGLENLSLIPGTVGAAPIQNIGAYGVELKSCVESVQAFDLAHALIQEVAPGSKGFRPLK